MNIVNGFFRDLLKDLKIPSLFWVVVAIAFVVMASVAQYVVVGSFEDVSIGSYVFLVIVCINAGNGIERRDNEQASKHRVNSNRNK